MNSRAWIGISLILTSVATLTIGECTINKGFLFPPTYSCSIDLGGIIFRDGQLFTWHLTCDDGGTDHWSTATVGRGTKAEFQSDGNLVVFKDDKLLFSSFTGGDETDLLVLRDDGNLVIVDNNNEIRWETGPFDSLVCPCDCEVTTCPPPHHPGGGYH